MNNVINISQSNSAKRFSCSTANYVKKPQISSIVPNELIEPKSSPSQPIKIFNNSIRFYNNSEKFQQVEIGTSKENDNEDCVINNRLSERIIENNSKKEYSTTKNMISNTGIMTNYDSKSLLGSVAHNNNIVKNDFADDTLFLSIIDSKKEKKPSGLKTKDLITIINKRKQLQVSNANKESVIKESNKKVNDDGVQTSFIFQEEMFVIHTNPDVVSEDNVNVNAPTPKKEDINNTLNNYMNIEHNEDTVTENNFEIINNDNTMKNSITTTNLAQKESEEFNKENNSIDNNNISQSIKCEETQVEELDFDKFRQQNETKEINISTSMHINDLNDNNTTIKKMNFFEETLNRIKKKETKDKIDIPVLSNKDKLVFDNKKLKKSNVFTSSRYDNNYKEIQKKTKNYNISYKPKNEIPFPKPKITIDTKSTKHTIIVDNNSRNNDTNVYKRKHIKTNSCVFTNNNMKTPVNIEKEQIKKKKPRKMQNYSEIYKVRMSSYKQSKRQNEESHHSRYLNRSMEINNIDITDNKQHEFYVPKIDSSITNRINNQQSNISYRERQYRPHNQSSIN